MAEALLILLRAIAARSIPIDPDGMGFEWLPPGLAAEVRADG